MPSCSLNNEYTRNNCDQLWIQPKQFRTKTSHGVCHGLHDDFTASSTNVPSSAVHKSGLPTYNHPPGWRSNGVDQQVGNVSPAWYDYITPYMNLISFIWFAILVRLFACIGQNKRCVCAVWVYISCTSMKLWLVVIKMSSAVRIM